MWGLPRRSFQSWLVRMPVRAGGLCLRSQVDIVHAAFIVGCEMACLSLEGRGASAGSWRGWLVRWKVGPRWQTILRSNCRTAREFESAWGVMQGEAMDCCEFLGQDLEGHLASPLQDVGQGCVDGSTRDG